ncbi:MAG: DUF3857 domain-containing protein [Rickettsiaceae bacterium]|nr:DUF3857 domain-containing protein [Rickettsiaceae bacterium]
MLRFHYKITTILLIALYSFTASARWAEYKDANYSIEKENTNIEVDADGQYTKIKEIKFKVLNEQGRVIFADFRTTYNNSAEKFDILEASCKTKGKIYKVPLNNIEDKPLASSNKGFDQNNQILIAFPNVEVGSEISITYKNRTLKPVLANNFFINFFYNAYTKNYEVNMQSKIPLYINVNNPKNALVVKETTKDGVYSLQIKNKKPIFDVVLNESGTLNPNFTHWVEVSSVKEWGDLAKKFAPKYESVINQKLPQLFEKIVAAAKKIKDPVAQINKVTSMLNEKIQYMGDWKTVEGSYYPRDLSTIAGSQIGDCKDFSVSAAAILKALGYKVNASLVHRGYHYESKNKLYNLASPFQFNHAFLRVVDKSGKIYWIDPTNYVSMAQDIFEDVSDRPALVLDSASPELTFTNSIDYKRNVNLWDRVISINPKSDNVADISANIDLKGYSAKGLTALALVSPQQQINDDVFYGLVRRRLNDNQKKFIKFSSKLTSRIVEDIEIKLAYEDDNIVSKTSSGLALPITNFSYDLLTDVNGQILNLAFYPGITKRTYTIKNNNNVDIEKVNTEINSKWIDYKIFATNIGKDIKLTEELAIKTPQINSSELATKEYIKLKEDLRKLGKSFIINLNN